MSELPPPDEVPAVGGLLLRRWRPSDQEALLAAQLASYEHLKPWMPWSLEPATPERVADYLVRTDALWVSGEGWTYGVWSGDGTLLGSFGIHNRLGPDALELGYWVTVGQTGRGVATAAAGALTGVCFDRPGIEWIEIHCDVANDASAAVARRLGYREVETFAKPPEAPGETGREFRFRLDRADWPASPAYAYRPVTAGEAPAAGRGRTA